jgi:hypothetical protein
MKEVNEDKDEAGQTDSEEVDSDEEEDEESFDEAESEDDVEYEDKEDSEDHDDADDEDDAIDIGSHVGLTFDDEEVFGTIIEFDDDEGTVTIKEDGTGDEVTGYQDDMFVE